MSKPIIRYQPASSGAVVLNMTVRVHALDHPTKGDVTYNTSKVMRMDAEGRFETAEHIYLPEGLN